MRAGHGQDVGFRDARCLPAPDCAGEARRAAAGMFQHVQHGLPAGGDRGGVDGAGLRDMLHRPETVRKRSGQGRGEAEGEAAGFGRGVVRAEPVAALTRCGRRELHAERHEEDQAAEEHGEAAKLRGEAALHFLCDRGGRGVQAGDHACLGQRVGDGVPALSEAVVVFHAGEDGMGRNAVGLVL